MKKHTGIIIVLILLALAGGFFLFASSGSRLPGGSGGNISLEDQIQTVPVKTMPVTAGTLEDYIRISGDVKAASSVDVYPDAAGTLSSITVSTGEYIQAGVTLAEVDPSRPGADYSKSPVDAPISGTVTEVYADIGETVSTSVPILEIGRLDSLEIKTYVSEKYVNRIATGQTAWIETDALPGVRLKARVSTVSPVVDPTSRTMELRLALNKNTKGLKSGMLADITLVLEQKTDVLKVPADAVIERSGGFYVFVVSGSSVSMKKVTTGLTIDNITEISAGLSADDTIVYSGMSMLADGTAIRILSEAEGLSAAGNVEGGNA